MVYKGLVALENVICRFCKLHLTPWKINMEPKNHQVEKGNHLANLRACVFHVNSLECT